MTRTLSASSRRVRSRVVSVQIDRGRRKHLGHERQGTGVVDVRVRHQDRLGRLGGQPVEGGQTVLPNARGRAHPRVDEHAPVPDP